MCSTLTSQMREVAACSMTYALSLHDALPISASELRVARLAALGLTNAEIADELVVTPHTVRFHLRGAYRKLEVSSDRKSTRLNSSHVKISYAVFCLKKKK